MQEFNYSAPLMGTTLDVSFIATEDSVALFKKILEAGQGYESLFSRFDETSELSQLNQKKQMKVSPLFVEVFVVAQQLYRQTDGVFNPLLSPLYLGYTSDFKTTNQNFKSQQQSFNTNFCEIGFDEKTHAIALQPDQQLDFGGFLKGYVAQVMANMVTDVPGVIINLGGDVYVSGKDLQSDAFHLVIDNPVDAKNEVPVTLKNEALATSGVYKRKWQSKHHIVDGTTHDSSTSDLISASVVSSDGAQADALATASIVLGSKKSVEMLDGLDLKYALIHNNGDITTNLKT